MYTFNTSKGLFRWTGAKICRRMPAYEIKIFIRRHTLRIRCSVTAPLETNGAVEVLHFKHLYYTQASLGTYKYMYQIFYNINFLHTFFILLVSVSIQNVADIQSLCQTIWISDEATQFPKAASKQKLKKKQELGHST